MKQFFLGPYFYYFFFWGEEFQDGDKPELPTGWELIF